MLELPPDGSPGTQLPSALNPKAAGKLDTPDTADRVSGGGSGEIQPPAVISPITGGYQVPGNINGVSFTLLVDTGAAVTLLREDVWTQIAARPGDLKPWSEPVWSVRGVHP